MIAQRLGPRASTRRRATPALTDINRAYYYNIDRPRGTTPVDIELYYPVADGKIQYRRAAAGD